MASRGGFRGTQQMAARVGQIAARFGFDAGAALYRRGEDIMAISKEHYVPVDLGTLKNTGKVFPPEWRGRRVSVALSYGDAATPYALAVHEHPSKHSPPSWQGKTVTFSPSGHGVKYLELPLMRAVPTLARDIAADLQFGRGAGPAGGGGRTV